MWYWKQYYTQDHVFPCIIVKPGNLVQSGGKVCQVNERNEIIEFTLLSTTPVHTFPHIYFTLVYHMKTVFKRVFFLFHNIASGPLSKCRSMHGTVELVCQLFIQDTHCHAKSHRNFITFHTHHSFSQFDTVFQVWDWNFCHRIFSKAFVNYIKWAPRIGILKFHLQRGFHSRLFPDAFFFL